MNDPLTHAYAHLLVDMQLAAFAPAFTVSLCESECSRKPQVRIASVVVGSKPKKKEETTATSWKLNLGRKRLKRERQRINQKQFYNF